MMIATNEASAIIPRIKNRIDAVMVSVLVRLLRHLEPVRREDVVFRMLRAETSALTPMEALRLLFRLDAKLYSLQKMVAVAYGDGLHPKVRHMRYPDFFAGRVSPGERVLDIGCGIGAVAYEVGRQVDAKVVGIDLRAANIEVARKRFVHPNVEYIVGDVTKRLPSARFDVAILSNVLEHLDNRPAFLRRVHEVVQPSRILLRVPLFERDWRVPLKKELDVEWRLDTDHKTEYTLESFDKELNEAGLVVAHKEVRWGEIWAEAVPMST